MPTMSEMMSLALSSLIHTSRSKKIELAPDLTATDGSHEAAGLADTMRANPCRARRRGGQTSCGYGMQTLWAHTTAEKPHYRRPHYEDRNNEKVATSLPNWKLLQFSGLETAIEERDVILPPPLHLNAVTLSSRSEC